MTLPNPVALLRALEPVQRRTFLAAFAGWMLDAFDFFLLVFVVSAVAKEFVQPIPAVAFAITVTLMLRPLGALIFGWAADRYGRRGPLMINIVFYSVVELATAFAPNFTAFILLRALYGVAMGGEWGVGAALAMESIPEHARGTLSGLLQEGYAFGYLLAAIVYYLIFPHFGWRGMFVAGALPAFIVLYIRANVPESPAWQAGARSRDSHASSSLIAAFRAQPALFIYTIALMAGFNFMSHGSQDLYPTFLQKQRGFGVGTVTLLAIVANIGAILGGILFGGFSQSIGRRRAIVTAALLGLLAIPLWVFAPSIALLGIGAFLMQFFVQGAWGVIPIHLNELSPPGIRGTFPGFTYQLGNLISAGSVQLEAAFAATSHTAGGGANYARALAIIMACIFVIVAGLAAIGRERRGRTLTATG